jgi:hypothetical protein
LLRYGFEVVLIDYVKAEVDKEEAKPNSKTAKTRQLALIERLI